MSDKFVHIHNHSYYSLLDGLASPRELVDCAVNMGYKALALTDHGSCAGLYKFQKYCIQKEIKPILGSEFYITEDRMAKSKDTSGSMFHLVVLAKNKKGYENLIKLSSLSYIEGFYKKPRIDFELLERHKEGLIVTSACVAGEMAVALKNGQKKRCLEIADKYRSVFGKDFYIEMMFHKYHLDSEQQRMEKKIALLLYSIAKETGISPICTNDTHYAYKEDWEAHDALLSIQTLNHIKNPDRFTFGSKDFYLKSYDEMFKIYGKAPELLSNTLEIAEKVESGLIVPEQDSLPDFDVPDGFSNQEDYLKALVVNGMKEKNIFNKKEYRERIKFEMSVILKCNYTKYFLILWDIINFARLNGIRWGAGRGSGAGSLCLYVLGVTKVDPLKYSLLFERFLNPDRISPPDVDLDFDYDRREEVYNYVTRKYKPDHCSQIGTYNKLKAKAAIRSTVKAMDLGNDWETFVKEKKKNPNLKKATTKNSLNLSDEISKILPAKPGITIQDYFNKNSYFKQKVSKYPKLLKCVTKIEGSVSSAGIHAAGILVCKDPIINKIPLRTSKGVICSQYEGPEVEELGFLKYDLLALKTLTVIDKTVNMIKERYGKTIDVDSLEPNDMNVFNMLGGKDKKKNCKGIFQFESDGIAGLLKQISVDRFEDMIAANALYRPGPLDGGVPDMYCDYKHKKRKIKYLHPKMGEVLDETYGLMVYQEHIMQVSRKLAGFTAGEADTLRKAIGKKKKELMVEMKHKFINGCVKNGIEKDVAVKIFEQIDFFGGYGFNKCLSGDVEVLNKVDGKLYSLSYLHEMFSSEQEQDAQPILLDSYDDGRIVEDELVDVFETGEKELYVVELSNGMVVECTLDHKFYCTDGKEYTVQEIMDKDLEIICEKDKNSEKLFECKITSIKSLGKHKTYNLTMKGFQHNYKITDKNGNSIYSKNSHSAAYAVIAYQTAWLKYYYPLEFMCNLLTSEIGGQDKNKMDVYMAAARKMDIKIYSTHLNRSGVEFKIDQILNPKKNEYVDILRIPLTALDGVGKKAVINIVENQPYYNLKDFLTKVDQRVVNVRVFNALVKAGAMDDAFSESREELLEHYGKIKDIIAKEKKIEAKKKKEKQVQKKEQKKQPNLWDDEPFGISSENLKV